MESLALTSEGDPAGLRLGQRRTFLGDSFTDPEVDVCTLLLFRSGTIHDLGLNLGQIIDGGHLVGSKGHDRQDHHETEGSGKA
ncbi:MAG TPA: hypothetical protein DD473_27510 [Planctomycetaceae bacterium]|nr:hypothetical protein [Planctomycetaceae bacterium]